MAPRQDSFNSYDLLKLLALALMTVDHAGHYLHLAQEEWWRVAGRAAAPIFCFLVGFNGIYRFRSELLIAAAAVSINEWLLTGAFLPLNILWPILFARLALQWLERKPQPTGVLILACLLWMPLFLFPFDYGTLPLLWALWGREVRRAPSSRTVYIYGTVSMALTVFYTFLAFDWNAAQMMAACATFLLLFVALSHFRLRELKPSAAGRFLSRHALSYYILHKTVLMAAGVLL